MFNALKIKSELGKKTGFSRTGLEIGGRLLTDFGIRDESTALRYLNIDMVEYHSPAKLRGNKKAAIRLKNAAKKKEKVIIHGDYDADGVTATVLMYRALREYGIECDWYVPDRQKDGYGLHPRNVKRFEEEGYTLLITVDTGIKEMKTISETTMDVIVTDHHEPVVATDRNDLAQYEDFSTIVERDGKFMAIPTCVAVVNPHRIDCDYPNTAVAGVTVAFKVMEMLYMALGKDTSFLYSMTDLVAAGQIADMIEQIDVKTQDLESRKFVVDGIRQIEKGTSTWATTFLSEIAPLEKYEVAEMKSMKLAEKKEYIKKRNVGKVSINDLGFTIGPFLNATGRMADASLSVEFLLEKNRSESARLFNEIKRINESRKQMKKEGQKVANEILSEETDFYAVAVVLPKTFHSGVVGLIAGDLARSYEMPTLCFAKKELDGELVLTASCRSVEGVSILAILVEVEETFGEYRYGGHQMAAGLTIPEARFDEFKKILNEVSKRHLEKKVVVDNAIPVTDMTLTQELSDFYIDMGSKNTFVIEDVRFNVKKLTARMVKMDFRGTSVWNFNFSPEEFETYTNLTKEDRVRMTFKINRFDGDICWMIESFEVI